MHDFTCEYFNPSMRKCFPLILPIMLIGIKMSQVWHSH